MKTLGIYKRVSTDEQTLTGVSLNNQESKGIELSKKLGLNYKVYSDEGYSGTLSVKDRPALKQLFEDVTSGDIHSIFVIDLDRLSRGDILQITLIKNIIKKYNVTLYDVNGEINLKDINQDFLTDMRSLLNAYENKKTSERIKSVLAQNVKEGKAGGGSIQNYGYTKDKDKKLIILEEEAKTVKLIFNLASKGWGTKKIANELNNQKIPTKRNGLEKGYMKVKNVKQVEFTWKDSVVYRILTNPIYNGERRHKGNTYPAPAIVTQKTFQFVQEALKERSQFKDTRNKYLYLLKGIIICPNCRSSFYGKKRKDLKDNQYICGSQRFSNFCGNRGINIDKIEKIVWKDVLNLPKNIKATIDDKNDDYKEKLRRNLNSANLKLAKLKHHNDILVGQIMRNEGLKVTLEKHLDEYLKKINFQQNKIANLERQLEMENEHQVLLKNITQQIQPLSKKNVPLEEKQLIIRSLISHIVVKWIEELNEHIVVIFYRISELSDLSIQGISKISYEKSGFSFRENKIVYQFATTNANKITKVRDSDGKVKTNIQLGENDFELNVFDFINKNFETFRELTKKARKRKGIIT
jgi:DNA invertase Pin-like site-specific DNA recombinase